MTTYNEYKAIKTVQNTLVTELSTIINKLPKDSTGMIQENIRMTEEYKSLNIQFEREFKKLQDINIFGNKNFKKEISKERKEKRKERYN